MSAKIAMATPLYWTRGMMESLKPVLGLRVVRGPDWEWGDQDGGEGYVGTVAGLEGDGGAVIVQWDTGQRCRYRCGEQGKYDLRILDSGPSGHRFPAVVCHVCRVEGIAGAAWRCLHCYDYYICSKCYHAGQHCLRHRFEGLFTKEGKGIRVHLRLDSRQVTARGIFSGATVVRGYDWKWGNQDGGQGKLGRVVGVKGAKDSQRSVVEVVWQDKNRKNIYRVGHKGKVDVKCISAGDGGRYYHEHLPLLGSQLVSPDPTDFVPGDRVRAEVDMDILKSLEGNPELAESFSLMLDHTGTVNSLLENGDLLVRYPNNSLLPLNPTVANKVDIPNFETGDVVRMIDDMAEVFQLQKGHGEWNDDMALCLGQVGIVVRAVPNRDLKVRFGRFVWMLNPHCVRPAPGEEAPAETAVTSTNKRKLSLSGLGLLSVMGSLGPDILVHATSEGDMATVKSYLEEHPDQVNVMVQGKTAVHVAIEESHMDILQVLLDFKPNLELECSDGDRPLHTCAFVNAIQASSMLLEAGADVNAKNSRRYSTPIMIAAALGHYKLLKTLVHHSTANVLVQDLAGQTALHHSILSHRTKAIPILLEAGADPAMFNADMFSPFLDAPRLGLLTAIEDILRFHPEVIDMRRPADNHTALHIASANARLSIVDHLARMGCDLNLKNDLQHTALHICSSEGHSQVIERLVGYGIDINAQDQDGNTALHTVLMKKSARPLSRHTPQLNKINDELQKLPLDSVPVFLVVACFLVQEGTDLRLRNKRGHHVFNVCPEGKGDVLINYINKSNRGEYHGSLKRSGAPVSNENNPIDGENTRNAPSAAHNTPPPPVATTSTVTVAAPSPSNGKPVNIMNQEKVPQGKGGHRERDRLKLLEERKKGGENATVQRKRQMETVLEAHREREKQKGSAGVVGQGFKDGANAEKPCFVCEMPADASFIPCGHSVACKKCAVKPKRCPICKVLVKGISVASV